MIEIEKIVNGAGYEEFTIRTNEGSFIITFQGTLDLYWQCDYEGLISETDKTKTFTIAKENYFLYSLLDEVYNSVKEIDPFGERHLKEEKTFNSELSCENEYNPERLFKDGKVEWHSDDFPYDLASIVSIEQSDEEYKIVFTKSKNWENIRSSFAVRFRTNGSRYEYFHAYL